MSRLVLIVVSEFCIILQVLPHRRTLSGDYISCNLQQILHADAVVVRLS